MIGIIGAMKEEVSSFVNSMKQIKKEQRAGLEFYCGSLLEKDIVVVQSGIGKVNAALATQLLIDFYRPSKLIFTGLAGSGDFSVAIGDFVLATSLVQHDFDLCHFGRELGVIPNVGRFIPCDSNLNSLLVKAFNKTKEKNSALGNLHLGVIASGDCFIARKEDVRRIGQEFNAIAVEMEGAAFAQVCFLNKIPFSVLRLISDNADEMAVADFPLILKKASKVEIEIVKELFNLI